MRISENHKFSQYRIVHKNSRVCFFLNMPGYFYLFTFLRNFIRDIYAFSQGNCSLFEMSLLIWIHDGADLEFSAVLLPLSVLRCSGKEYISR